MTTQDLPFDPEPDEAEFEITVLIEDGICTGVLMNGERIRANVHDYDVQYPISQNQIKQDEEGRDFIPMIIQ